MSQLAAETMARRRLVWPNVCRCWLPVWLPTGLPADRGSPLAGTPGNEPRLLRRGTSMTRQVLESRAYALLLRVPCEGIVARLGRAFTG
jgi:hypothetical protein